MAVEIVQKHGKDYFRWGITGKLYPTKEKAMRQGRAIKARNRNKVNGT